MKTAMILAAGFGTRLRPYSKLRPKPLFPVLGRPLILRTIEKLREAGFTRIIVNSHYLGQQITTLLANETDIICQQESIELGTGGGMRMAIAHLGSAPVLITNADLYHDIDYDLVYREHCRKSSTITMVMHNYPRFNKVLVKDNQLLPFSQNFIYADDINKDKKNQRLAYTGIQVIEPAFLENIPPGVFANIIDYYESYLRNGGQINTITIKDFWADIGTPDDYLALHGHLLSNNSPGDDWLPLNNRGFYRANNARMGNNITCLDWGIIGRGAAVGDNVNLKRVVVWDGANIPSGSIIQDKIITK